MKILIVNAQYVIVEVTESGQTFREINFFTKQKMCGNED